MSLYLLTSCRESRRQSSLVDFLSDEARVRIPDERRHRRLVPDVRPRIRSGSGCIPFGRGVPLPRRGGRLGAAAPVVPMRRTGAMDVNNARGTDPGAGVASAPSATFGAGLHPSRKRDRRPATTPGGVQ